jgi:hypothetical protein
MDAELGFLNSLARCQVMQFNRNRRVIGLMDRRAYREETSRNSARKTEGKGALFFATFTYRYCADIEFASFSFCLATPVRSLLSPFI